MAFRIAIARSTFPFTVDIREPGEDAPPPQKLKLIGNRKTKREIEELSNTGANDVEKVMQAVSGFGEQVIGLDGEPKEWNADAVRELLDVYPGAALAIYLAYLSEHAEARLKNSGGPRGG